MSFSSWILYSSLAKIRTVNPRRWRDFGWKSRKSDILKFSRFLPRGRFCQNKNRDVEVSERWTSLRKLFLRKLSSGDCPGFKKTRISEGSSFSRVNFSGTSRSQPTSCAACKDFEVLGPSEVPGDYHSATETRFRWLRSTLPAQVFAVLFKPSPLPPPSGKRLETADYSVCVRIHSPSLCLKTNAARCTVRHASCQIRRRDFRVRITFIQGFLSRFPRFLLFWDWEKNCQLIHCFKIVRFFKLNAFYIKIKS